MSFAETILSAFLVDKIGTIARETGGFGAVFVVFACLFTFALAMVFVFMRERWLPQPSAAETFRVTAGLGAQANRNETMDTPEDC